MLNALKQHNRDVDLRSYFIGERRFGQLAPIDILRHNVAHLVNLLAKISFVANGPEIGWPGAGRYPADVIQCQVIPDLVIYALQFAEALDVDIDQLTAAALAETTPPVDDEDALDWMVRAQAAADGLAGLTGARTEQEVLRHAGHDLLLASAEVSKVCDSDAHNLVPCFDQVGYVTIGCMLAWSARLARMFGVPLGASYRARLDDVLRKYA